MPCAFFTQFNAFAERIIMGSIVHTIPDIPDANLIYDENETRQILKFFWPNFSEVIDTMTITNDTRRLAQTALIAAIDGSYAMGYVSALWDTMTHAVTRNNRNIPALARRLARNFIRHWWRHTREQDLADVQIYETVRADIARNLRRRLDAFANDVALKRDTTTVTLA